MAGCLGAVATSADPAADGPSLLRALDFGGYNLRAYIAVTVYDRLPGSAGDRQVCIQKGNTTLPRTA